MITDITAKSIVKKFIKWCNKYGIPQKLLSDQGRQYISSEMKKILDSNKIKHIKTSSHNPTCNGISERLNSTIGVICRISKGMSIKELINNIFKGINFTCNSRLGVSPFEMIYKYSHFDMLKRNLQNQVTKAKEKEISISMKDNFQRNKNG
ncbi:Retrovirus-related Pol polyprotein from transposon TNT 1-94 [Dictyocoela roeselum]|nr:Retrovirus-related Pol polyprotein from transposon TNT 1-94 [Dictyocoela roeselum]